MNPNIQGQQIQTRKALLVFLKVVAPPLVFYVDNPDETYLEIRNIMANAKPQMPKIIERLGKGPLKKLAVFDTQIAGVAIQEEPA
ncbi:MAG TPA: hypothetical protein P5556_11045 [Candidatus Gastranaerophilales bacterium]|nr:hypothetical protein [Candidatus Gastranaerophilales bacterium]